MANADTQAQQPDCQRRIGMVLVKAPWGAVVHQHPLRQTIASEDSGQALSHGLSQLVSAGLQSQGKSGVVVQNSQRMAASLGKGEVAFEVHLPQVVGCLVLKSLPGTVLGPLGWVNATMTTQDRRDSTGGRHVRLKHIPAVQKPPSAAYELPRPDVPHGQTVSPAQPALGCVQASGGAT